MCSRILLTAEGLERLKNELVLLKEKANVLVARIEDVAQPDESGEDGLATQLKEELELVNAKIDELEETISGAKLISGHPDKSRVQVGHTVKLKIAASVKKFEIVSEFEADPANGRISDQSPLGKALIGRKLNDIIEIEAPVGKFSYKIVAIS